MSPGEFSYADNWNFAKVYCSSIIGASEKIAHPELHFFVILNHSLAYMFTRELNYADNWNFAKVYCSVLSIDASGILAQSFSSRSKFSKSVKLIA